MVIKYNESDKNLKSSRVIERWFTDGAYKYYALLEAFDDGPDK